MNELKESIDIQIESNQSKNLFFKDISNIMQISLLTFSTIQMKNFSDEDITESDACVVSVKQILELDDSLNELDLKPGQAAERSDADAPWQTIKQKSSRNNSFAEDDEN